MKVISVVVPVFNNEGSLPVLYQKLVSEIKNYPSPLDYQLIFVNDGSSDKSLEVLLGIRERDKKVSVINFSRNFGEVAGILAGWNVASGDAVVNMSADLQDPVEQVSKMIKEWEQGSEVVISYRIARDDTLSEKITSKLAYFILRQSVPKLPPGGFSFALLDRKALIAVKQIREKNRFYQGDLLWVGFNLKFIPYTRQKRVHGSSGYNFAKRVGYFVVAYLNTSYFPIRSMSIVGILTALAGFLYSIVIIYAYFVHNTPFVGWAPIMMVLLIMGGLLMTMVGIIGEYIWRIYDEVKNRPNYIIKDEYT